MLRTGLGVELDSALKHEALTGHPDSPYVTILPTFNTHKSLRGVNGDADSDFEDRVKSEILSF